MSHHNEPDAIIAQNDETATVKLERIRSYKSSIEELQEPQTPSTLLPAEKMQEVQKTELDNTPLPLPPPLLTYKKLSPGKFNSRKDANVRMVQESCRRLCLSLFFRQQCPVRTLGFTSSIEGEGKSFLALTTALMLARDSYEPVTLIDCNWEHPTLHEHFGIPSTFGLAEWLRGTCDEDDIRHHVDDNLTFIPAGNGSQDAVKLLQQIQRHDFLKLFKNSKERFVVDLPPIITTGYGSLAAGLLEAIVIVVRAGIVPDTMVAETCEQLKDLPVHGIILNQSDIRIS